LTEAAYFVHERVGRRVNWSELINLFHAKVNLETVRQSYRPPQSPPLPQSVEVTTGAGGGNTVTWQGVPGAAGYRVYRADRMGGPWFFVNSPYAAPGKDTLAKAPPFEDGDGKPGQAYWVTAVDRDGRESRWFADEPLPDPGAEAR
jgi:hypothetical protein